MSRKETLQQFASCWEGLEDPRRGNAALHDFHELLMMALCCVLCGGQGAVDMAVFAEAKEPFLRSFLTLANGLAMRPARVWYSWYTRPASCETKKEVPELPRREPDLAKRPPLKSRIFG